jgi:hypothetical protein
MAQEYPNYKDFPFGCLAKHVALQDVNIVGVYSKNTHQEAQQVENFQIKF